MSVESFIKEWEAISVISAKSGVRVFNNVEAKVVKTGWDNTVKLQSVRSLSPKQGNATSLVKKINELAKTHNVIIRLTAQNLNPWKQSSMNRNEICNWFKKNGFKPLFTWPDNTGVEMSSR